MNKALKDLIISKNKRIQTNFIIKINFTEFDSFFDEIRINLSDDFSEYNNIYIIKGDIFPTPKINNYLKVKEIYLEYDKNLMIKLYLNGEIINNNQNKEEELNKIINVIDLNYTKLFSYLKDLSEIENVLMSSVFLVKDIDANNDYYKLLNYEDFKEYTIQKKSIINLNKEQIILINNYQLIKENEILICDLTMFKLLTEEEFFYIIYRIIKVNFDIFKVIDIEKNYLILINRNKKLFKLENNNNIALGKLILMSNFTKNNIDDIFQLIKIDKNTYIQQSKNYIFYSKRLYIIQLSCIKFYIKDYRINNNEYNKIKISDTEKEIQNNEIYFIFNTNNDKYFDYFPIQIELYHSKKNQLNKVFHFLLYQGFINKINLLVNFCSLNSYFYEYLYYDIYDKLNNFEEILFCEDGNKYIFNIYDNFNSVNRRRINVMNVPQQKFLVDNLLDDYDDNNDNKECIYKLVSNSIQICKLIKKGIIKIFGIFNIKEIKIPILKCNDIFDKYYDEFGNIFNELMNYNNKNYNKEMINIYSNKYINCDLPKDSHLLTNFNENITLSQYKTRLGYLICYYFNFKKGENSFYKFLCQYLLNINFYLSYKDIGLFKKLRIITFYLREKVKNKVTSLNLYFFEDLNDSNPYNLANKFNIEEINNLNEFSRLFLAYIQLDSYILFNYCINEYSYSFSLETLYMIQFHLKSNYEEFFFTSRDFSDKYAYQAVEEKITIINEKTLFKKEFNDKEIVDIEEPNKSKHYALPISMEFRHEKNSHQKINPKNPGLFSPICYVRDLKYKKYSEKISIYIKGKDGKIEKKTQIKGESGKMVESFFSSDEKKINRLKTELIYGDLFDEKLF